MNSEPLMGFLHYLHLQLRLELTKQIPLSAFPNVVPLLTPLQQRRISFEIDHHRTYTFPESYTSPKDETANRYSKHDPKVKAFGFDSFAEKVYAVEQGGRVVSACVSTRENDSCGEAWVYIGETHRRCGLAQKVVSIWARSLLSSGKVPFYSHKIQNIASANLAKRLGLQPVFEEIVILHANV